MSKIDESGKKFLILQRSQNRQGHLEGIDKKGTLAEKRKSDKMDAESERKRRCELEKAHFNGKIIIYFEF